MAYISNFMPEELFSQLIHGEVIDYNKDFLNIENKNVQFRNQSNVKVTVSPCGCMGNNTTQTSSS